jgi:hypothetical protein
MEKKIFKELPIRMNESEYEDTDMAATVDGLKIRKTTIDLNQVVNYRENIFYEKEKKISWTYVEASGSNSFCIAMDYKDFDCIMRENFYESFQ